MAEKIDLVIIGAGPAGIGATLEASRLGISTIIIDSFSQPGGQYYKLPPIEFNIESGQNIHSHPLVSGLNNRYIKILISTIVWGIFKEEDNFLLCLFGPKGTPRRIIAKQVILATGAFDRPVPFPGWTLPGVMLAGAVMSLLKNQLILPGKRVLLSGTGPLQIILASRLINAGAEVVALLDANPFPWKGLRFIRDVWGQWERLDEGWNSIHVMTKAGLSIKWGHTVKWVEGNTQVERAVIGKVDQSTKTTLEVDTVCLGYGFIPSAQLSLQAGCQHKYSYHTNSFTPVRDEWLQTSIPGLFVAGDGGGIGGKDVALIEGRLAASRVGIHLGIPIDSDKIERLYRELACQRRFAGVLNALFPFPQLLWDLVNKDTIICRCEEVTVADIQRAISEGATTLNAIKNITRAGMGRCQGRMCTGTIAHIISESLGIETKDIVYSIPRPPVIPIPVEGVLEEELN